MIKAAFGHACSRAQLIHGHRFVAVRVNHFVCGLNQPLPGIARSPHNLLLRHPSCNCGLYSTEYHEGEKMSSGPHSLCQLLVALPTYYMIYSFLLKTKLLEDLIVWELTTSQYCRETALAPR